MKRFIYIIVLIVIAALPYKIEAAICNQEAYKKAEKDAYNLQFSWEVKTGFDEFTTTDIVYYEITVTGLTKDVAVATEEGYITYGSNPENPATAVYRLGYEGHAFTYLQTIKASQENDCTGEIVYNKKMSLPAYNIYYQSEECIENPDFKYCQKDYAGEQLTKDEFNTALEKYLKDLEVKNPDGEEEPNDNKSFIDKTIDFITEHKVLSIAVASLIVIVAAVVIVRKIIRSRKRVKIDLEV